MKRLSFGIALVAGITAFAQDQRDLETRAVTLIGPAGQTVVLEIHRPVVPQAIAEPPGTFRADVKTVEKLLIRLKGNVEIRTDTMLIQADEAEYTRSTGEIEAHGNVRITPIAKPQ